VVKDYLKGEVGYKTGLRIVLSLQNAHKAYIAWMGLQMVYPPEGIRGFNAGTTLCLSGCLMTW
jgi:hypothetical protein